MILGLDEDTHFKDTTFTVPPEHALLVYTDALIEEEKTDGSMTGEDGVLSTAQNAFGAEEPIDALLDGLLELAGAEEFSDDILVFWLEREG
jgi:serine phosphatase RsbU (regulator of sigma subunit)